MQSFYTKFFFKKIKVGRSLLVEHLPNMHEGLGSIPKMERSAFKEHQRHQDWFLDITASPCTQTSW